MKPDSANLTKSLATDVTVIIIAVASVLLLKYAIVHFNLEHWFGDIPSDIFMALLTALLAIVLFRAEQLKTELTRHRDAWEKGTNELLEEKKLISDLRKKIDNAFNDFITYSVNRTRLYEISKSSTNKDAIKTLESKSLDVTVAWADLIFKNYSTAPEEINYLSSKCFELMYESYMDEEKKDVSGKLIVSKDLPPYLIATNYPTYLNFINRLTTHFIENADAYKTKYKPCFLAFARNIPIEWIMLCKKEGDKFICKGPDKNVLDWRNTSANLAKLSSDNKVLFRRVFITRDNDTDEALKKFMTVPTASEFKDLLSNGYAWYYESDADILRKPYSKSYVSIFRSEDIEKFHSINYDDAEDIFFISSPTNKTGIKHEALQLTKIKLADFLVQKLHLNNKESIRSLKLTSSGLSNMGYIPGFPTDMFIVGIVPNDNASFDKIEPLMGVASLFTDSDNQVSILNFFTRDYLIKENILQLIKNIANAPELSI